MVRLRVMELLEERGRSKYWLWQALGHPGYSNFDKMIKNKTYSIRYDMIDKLIRILDCSIEELFEVTDEDEHPLSL